MNEQSKHDRGRKRIADLKAFYVHAFVFVAVTASLAALNIALGSPFWILWVLLGWGIGLGFHAVLIFGKGVGVVSRWEERKLKALMDQDDPSKVGSGQSTKPQS